MRIRRSVNSKERRQRKRKREVIAYQENLPLIDVGTAPFVSAHLSNEESEEWLLLEAVSGKKVAYCENLECWYAVAAWLAKFHEQVRGLGRRSLEFEAFRFDQQYFRDTANAMRVLISASHPKFAARAQALEAKVLYLAEYLGDKPLTWVHGSFTPLNILIRPYDDRPSGEEVCPAVIVNKVVVSIDHAALDFCSFSA